MQTADVIAKKDNVQFDEATVLDALKEADINVLRLALYQQTGDQELAAMSVVQHQREGSPFKHTMVDPKHHDTVREKAKAYLLSGAGTMNIPSKSQAYEMMEVFYGRELSQSDKDYCWGDLAFEGFPRGAAWANKPPQEVLDDITVTIIGAGFSGLLAAIQMERLGLKWRIIERQSGLGGTWWLNDYLEARVDVTSFLYQFKFELGYPWKNFYATQGELQEYVAYIVDKHNLRDRITLDTKVTKAVWNEDAKSWQMEIEGPDGTAEAFDSTFIISASGQFSTPQLPNIEGIESFKGKMFHSTEWDHDYDLNGKRVAIIGTGSTGSQMTRGIAERASHLTVYQRTPNWLMKMPRYRDKVPTGLQWLMDNMPGYKNWYVFGEHISQLRMDGMNDVDEAWRAKGGHINERNDQLRELLKGYIFKAVKGDKDLYKKLVPSYAPLARRPVVDNDWYKTLTLDHVDLAADGIERFTETGIVSKDGVERGHDAVVLTSGFAVERFLWPVEYVGRDGATLEKLWEKDGPRAYKTAMLPGFPNFVMMYGPNSGLVGGSYHSWVELYSQYYCRVITETIERRAESFELKREAYDAFNEELDEKERTWVYHVENGGGGYYMNQHGRSSVRLPWKLPEFYEKLREPDFNDYSIE